ncbi:MAG: glycoside hydrolase family 127 protein, partial [Planctomycetales bacterium]|nr:glycoside hydrolase family 127 protein [Planctomycetales bacterium]
MSTSVAQQTEGDQFLDGIGETSLAARYMLSGDSRDSTRNERHATLHGEAKFVDDAHFGKVLVLSGKADNFLQLPSDALDGMDSLSVTGWLLLDSDGAWQRFFDFGRGPAASFFCTPLGGSVDDGYRARLTTQGWAAEQGPTAQRLALNQWVHLAVVLDAEAKTLAIYADGRRVAMANDVDLSLDSVIGEQDGGERRFFIGKSQYDADPLLNARVHDLRIYSVPLNDEQVSKIARRGGAHGATARSEKVEPNGGGASATAPQAFAKAIASVPPVAATTTVGTLPRLPRWVRVDYVDGSTEPPVRVIWPAPRDNAEALTAGSYEVTGEIPGSEMAARATITVVEERATDVPQRTIEAFALSEVTLDADANGVATPFVKNRDKFLQGLAKTNPDNFLYMFRNAFGETQPDAAEPLGVWDSQTTRLRGHATGHYLTAIAQAYASTGYDRGLQNQFKEKLDYLVNSLYELSQKSGRPAADGGVHVADPVEVPPGAGKAGFDSDLTVEGIRTDYWNWGEGFISAYPPDQFIMLEHGATYGGRNDQIWAPYYTLHKILAGLLDCYELGGREKALETAHGMGKWVHRRLQRVPVETRIAMWNRYIAGEYGGMN